MGVLSSQDAYGVQLDNQWYMAVVNKSSDEIAKTLGTCLTAPQIAFLKSVVRSL